MTLNQWRNRITKDSPKVAEEAFALISRSDFRGVNLCLNRDTGDWLWAIAVVTSNPADNDFWLDAFPTRGESEALCKDAGWQILATFEEEKSPEEVSDHAM